MGYRLLPPPAQVLLLSSGAPVPVLREGSGDVLLQTENGLQLLAITASEVIQVLPTVVPVEVQVDYEGINGDVLVQTPSGLVVLHVNTIKYESVLIEAAAGPVTQNLPATSRAGEFLVLNQGGQPSTLSVVTPPLTHTFDAVQAFSTLGIPFVWDSSLQDKDGALQISFSHQPITRQDSHFNLSDTFTFSTVVQYREASNLAWTDWMPTTKFPTYGWSFTRFMPVIGYSHSTIGFGMGVLTKRNYDQRLEVAHKFGILSRIYPELVNLSWYKYPLTVWHEPVDFSYHTASVVIRHVKLASKFNTYDNWVPVPFEFKFNTGVITKVESPEGVGISNKMGVLSNKSISFQYRFSMGVIHDEVRGWGFQFKTTGVPEPFQHRMFMAWTTYSGWERSDLQLNWALQAQAVRLDWNMDHLTARLATPEADFAYTRRYKVDHKRHTASWAVERPITVGFSFKAPYGVTAGLTVAYTLREKLVRGCMVSSPLLREVVAGGILNLNMSRVCGGRKLDASLRRVVVNGASFNAPTTFDALAGRTFALPARDSVSQGVVISWDLLERNPVSAEWVGSSPLFDSAPLVQNTEFKIVLPSGQEVEIESGEVSIDEGNYGWSGSFNLVRLEDLRLFTPHSKFEVFIGGERYVFVVDFKSSQRNSPAGMVANVKGMSPAVQLTATRTGAITRTWDQATTAHAILAEVLAGSSSAPVPFDYQIQIPNWPIPANRFGVSAQAPLDIARQVVTAVGGILDSLPDGTLLLRPKYPFSVPVWGPDVSSMAFSDDEDVFSVSDEYSASLAFNKFRVMDSQTVNNGDRLDYTELTAGEGEIRAYPSPWRENVELFSTSSGATADLSSVEYRDVEETVQVYNGSGSVQFPIVSVNSLEWLDTNLLGVVAGSDSPSFTTTHPTEKFSMVKINYRTRCLLFPVSGVIGSTAQFLLRNLDG